MAVDPGRASPQCLPPLCPGHVNTAGSESGSDTGDDEQASLSSVVREKQGCLRAVSPAGRGNGGTEKQKSVCTRVHTHASVLACVYGRERHESELSSGI